MAPYDRAAYAGDDGLPPPLHVTNHGTGIHSISQHDGSQEFEVKLLTLKSSNDKPKQKQTHQRQRHRQQHDQEQHNQQPHDQQPQPNNTVNNNNNNNNNNTKFSAKRWAFRKIEKGDSSNRKSSKNSKKQKKEPANHPTAAATLFSNHKPTKEQTLKQAKEGKGGGTARVSFNRETRIRQIPHRSEISPELKALLWVNYHDWQATQGERQRISRAVLFDRLTIDTQTDDLYLRGLETLIPELATLRRDTIHAAKALVLQEQARARLEREPLDGVRLARWYGSATRGSRQAAWEQAIEDYCQVLDDLRQGRSLADIV